MSLMFWVVVIMGSVVIVVGICTVAAIMFTGQKETHSKEIINANNRLLEMRKDDWRRYRG